jgi:hypothetical protein
MELASRKKELKSKQVSKIDFCGAMGGLAGQQDTISSNKKLAILCPAPAARLLLHWLPLQKGETNCSNYFLWSRPLI